MYYNKSYVNVVSLSLKIPGIFYLIFSDCGWLQVTETMERGNDSTP